MLRRWTVLLLLCCLAFRAWAGAVMVAGDGHGSLHGIATALSVVPDAVHHASHGPASDPSQAQLELAGATDCHGALIDETNTAGNAGCLLCALCHSPVATLSLPELTNLPVPRSPPLRLDATPFAGIALPPDTPPPIV